MESKVKKLWNKLTGKKSEPLESEPSYTPDLEGAKKALAPKAQPVDLSKMNRHNRRAFLKWVEREGKKLRKQAERKAKRLKK